MTQCNVTSFIIANEKGSNPSEQDFLIVSSK